MHNTIGTRPRRTVACAGLLFALVLGGCTAGSDDTAQLSTGDGASNNDSDAGQAVDDTNAEAPPTPTTTTTVAPTTSPPPTRPPTTVRPTTTTALRPATTIRQAPAPTTPPPTAAPPPPTEPPTTTAPAPKPAASSSGQCHASYQGTCIPPDVSDADCAGGSGNGPWYVQEKNVRVVGSDVFDLDSDNDGLGCET